MSDGDASDLKANAEPVSSSSSAGDASAASKASMDAGAPAHTYNIFVGDLPANISEVQLQQHFEPFGEIKTINVIRDKTNGACKGTPSPLPAHHSSIAASFWHLLEHLAMKKANHRRFVLIHGVCGTGYAFVHFVTKEAREKVLLPENAAPLIGVRIAWVSAQLFGYLCEPAF